MSIAYIVIVFFVTALLLSLPLFPFWKVWTRVKTHHADIWNAKGPFEVMGMITAPGLVRGFMEMIYEVAEDESPQKKDPELVKWCRLSKEVWKMMPSSFPGQVACFLVFLYFTGFFTYLILQLFN